MNQCHTEILAPIFASTLRTLSLHWDALSNNLEMPGVAEYEGFQLGRHAHDVCDYLRLSESTFVLISRFHLSARTRCLALADCIHQPLKYPELLA